jgi:hypothetical protein
VARSIYAKQVSNPMSQTVQTLEIQGSPAKLAGLLFLGILMTAASAFVALGGIARPGSYIEFIGWVGVAFFGAILALIVYRFFNAKEVLVTITDEGILDKRVAARTIPWAAVRKVSVWEHQRQKVIVLDVPPEVEGSIEMTRMARFTRGPNKSLGADGLCITAAGLKISHDELLARVMEHVGAATLRTS